jgi:hypothetical protein
VSNIERQEIFKLIEQERERQDKLHPLPKRKKTEDADVDAVSALIFHNEFSVVLTEEFLEVVRALQGEGSLKDELVQVASVCVRWIENMK